MTVTFDTDVLVYATEPRESVKYARAMDLIARSIRAGTGVLLFQTLGEFSRVGLRRGMSVGTVRSALLPWRAVLPVPEAIPPDIDAALDAVHAHKLPFWDAMLWAAADRLGIDHLLSEDFQDGRKLGRVRFLDPFNRANDAAIDAVVSA